MGSFTGSIQTAARILSPFFEKASLSLTLLQGGATALKEGQEVYLSAAGTVQARTLGTQFPIGTVTVGKSDRNGPRVTVSTVFNRDINATAGASAIAAGDFVKQNGTKGSDNEPVYVAAAVGDYVLGVALAGAAANGTLRVGVLRAPFKL